MNEVIDALDQYLREIGQVPLLTSAAEIELARAIEAGNEAAALLRDADHRTTDDADRLAEIVDRGDEARQRLTESNLRLVVSVARRFMNRGLPLGDLIQEGNFGLMRAVEKFDHRRGFRFSTCAVHWIRQAIGRALADKSRLIRLPAHIDDLVGKYARASSDPREQLGRDHTLDEIASALNVSPKRLSAVVDIAQRPISLDVATGGESDATLADVLPDMGADTADDIADRMASRELIEGALSRLTRREWQVIVLRFGLLDDRTRSSRAEVGAALGLTVAQVQAIEGAALQKLRRSCQAA